jgi:hypothetical protein
MSAVWDRLHARIEAEHAAEVERGEHDSACESRERSRLCHCSKRRREAAGYTEPPGELIHQAPLCPRCYGEVNVDADGFDCSDCSVSWGRDGITAEFTDDYGDLSAPAPSMQIGAG